MAKADGLIDVRLHDSMTTDIKRELCRLIKRHVGPAVYRGQYPGSTAVSACLETGDPDTFLELTVAIDWENLPRPNAKEDWHETENGLYVPKGELKKSETKKAVPISEEGLKPKQLRRHCKRIGQTVYNSLYNDPLWAEEELGWQQALRDGTVPSQMLGVLAEPKPAAMWVATYS